MITDKANQNALRLLIVDNNERFLGIMCDYLAGQYTFDTIQTARNGAEALEIATHLHPHIILMDYAMPGMNGLQAIQQLRKKFPDIAIIMLTMHDAEVYRDATIAAGADEFILKKAIVPELLLAIERFSQGKIAL